MQAQADQEHAVSSLEPAMYLQANLHLCFTNVQRVCCNALHHMNKAQSAALGMLDALSRHAVCIMGSNLEPAKPLQD